MRLLRLLLFVIHLGIAALLLAMLANAVVPPKVFPYFNLIPLGFPLLMAAHIFLCLFWIFSWRKRAFVFLLFMVLLFNPAKRWVNFSDKKGKSDLKVLSFNTRSGFGDFNKISEYIEAQKPDIAILQEVSSAADAPFFKNQIKNPIVYIGTNFDVINSGRVDNGSPSGSCAFADVKIRGKIVRVINVYLNPFSLDKQTVRPDRNLDDNKAKAGYLLHKLIPVFKIHETEVEHLADFVKSSPYPVILAGDFNSVPNSYEYYHIEGVLQDAFSTAGSGSATSFHDYKYPIRIDYVFSSKALKPISYKVDRTVHISDHFPVLAEFNIE